MKILLFLYVAFLVNSIHSAGQGSVPVPSTTPAPTCTNGKIYETCGTLCPLTCANKDNGPRLCPLECVTGCFCPYGMAEYNGGCVQPDDCPSTSSQATPSPSSLPKTCKVGNNTYKEGESFLAQDGCNTCFCSNGLVACTLMACPPVTSSPSTTTPGYQAPYVEPPMECPETNSSSIGSCLTDDACLPEGIGDCDSGKLCCSNGCGVVCKTGIVPTPLCPAVKSKAQNMSSGLLGAYIPQCEESGDFSQIQCHEGYCWCVDSQTGKATTQPVRGHPTCTTSTTSSVPTSTTPTCTNGMIYSTCGSPCPLTCANKDNPPECIQECVQGCFCPTGMVTNAQGTCVSPSSCPTMPSVSLPMPSSAPTSGYQVPYVEPPMECPETNSSIIGSCLIEDPCLPEGNGDCGSGKLCCSNGCGIVCKTGIVPTPLCPAVKSKAQNMSSGLLGVYIPQCEESGDFSQIQCHEGYCWCVDSQTGKATTQPVRGQPTCTTSTTPTSFSIPAYCSLPSQAGMCKAYFPSYYYNSTTQQCVQFIYGGCGGNDNRFTTYQSCLETCVVGALIQLPSIEANLTQIKMCPSTSSDTVGVCSELCSTDDVCEDSEMCCSNGCGHACVTPTAVPYYKPPMKCPPIDPILGVFCSIDFGCKSNEACQEDQLCCPTGCGSMCVKAVKPTPLCSAIRNSTMSKGLIGAYIPQCDDNGNFSSVQCHASTGMCWCANTLTGKPLSSPVMFQQPECEALNCAGIQCDWPNCGEGIKPITDNQQCCPYCPPGSCKVGDKIYADGSTFASPDGCNTCTCTKGASFCTLMACLASCTMGNKTVASGTSVQSPDGCNTCTCSDGVLGCTEMACLVVCTAGGMTIVDGGQVDDGCSVCTCHNRKITCVQSSSCDSPIHRIINITMKFNGNYDTITQNMDSFKQEIKNSLVNKYSGTTGLHEAQITHILVTRGSIIITVTIGDDSSLPNSANVTLLVVQMQQDYNNKTLVINYQDTTLQPSGNFTYSQTNCQGDDDSDNEEEQALFWVYVSVCGILLLLIGLMSVLIIVVYKKRHQRFAHSRLPTSDNEYDVTIKGVKGVPNPMFVVKVPEKI